MPISYFNKPVYLTFTTRNAKGETNKPEQVIAFVRYGGKVFKFATGIKVVPGHLQNGTIAFKKDREANEKNKALNSFAVSLERIFRTAEANHRMVDNDFLREELNNEKPKMEAVALDFLAYVASFCEKAKTRLNPKSGQPLAKRTLYKYTEVQALLKEFAAKKGLYLSFELVASPDFANSWIAFLQTDKSYSLNSIGTFNKKVKEFVNAAIREGVTQVQSLRLSDLKSFGEDVEKVYLSEAELKRIWELENLPPYLAKARDLFLIGCWTGLRVSDYTELTKANIWGGDIHIKQNKTQDPVTIPIYSIVNIILEKYGYELPKISQQKLNDYIKQVAEAAAIDEPISTTITKAGKKLTITKPKYEWVTTHTGRRSFATNLYLSGFPSIDIMKITGHRTEQAFMRYIRITNEQTAEKLRAHWAKLASV
jgi:integrase